MHEPETAAPRFSRLHEEHFEAVRRYAWRRDPATADDVAAETFVVAWRRLGEIPADARPWLIGVARNVRLNILRSQRRQHALAAELAHARRGQLEIADPVSAGVSEDVADALARLAPLDREVLLLHAWDELDRGEIAAALGCSKANVSVRLHRARRRFRQAFASSSGPDVSPVSTSEGAVDGC